MTDGIAGALIIEKEEIMKTGAAASAAVAAETDFLLHLYLQQGAPLHQDGEIGRDTAQ